MVAPRFSPVFAAGNFGLSAGAPSTVTSPATCKNGVAVGASLGWSGPNVASAVVGDSATMNVRSRITGTVEAFTVYMAAVGADRFATGRPTGSPRRRVAAGRVLELHRSVPRCRGVGHAGRVLLLR